MKSKKMKQGMSWLLCMVMLLSNNVTVLADETDSSGEGQTQDVSAEETEASTEEAGVTTELETEETVETTEQTEPVEEEQPVYNEAVQLRHEFKDENGNVISVVTADIQEGSFEADASAISMEVDTLTEEEDSYMQGLIRENLPEYTYLGDYVLYDVVFKVNGELTDPMKEIKLTYEGTGIDVQDIQDAVVCQYNVADPEVTDDKDSVTEIIQRDDMIRYMEENGEDTSKVDDHDLSEVVLNENGAADQISMEVRKSSIFGCYVEELSQETAFSQEVNGTTITVTAPEGAFPMDADQVSMAAAPLSEEQAAAVEEQLSAQAESQGQELKGYAAYDISLWANGEEIQPQKPVTVTMENTGLDVAETLTAFQVSDEDNSVSNIGSIDENGTVSMETAAVLPAGTAAFGEPEVQDEETVTGDTEQTTDETGETADSDKQDEISGEDENKEDTAEEEDKKTEEENIKEENIKDEEKDSNQTDAENEEDAEKETAETGNEKENIEKEETKNNSEEAVTTDENTDDEENNEKEAETIVSEPVTLTEEKGGVTVILTAPEGAFPVDSNQVSMTVEELTEEQKAIIEEQLQAQADENGQELKGYVAYDITLWANGEIIQPQVPVTVTFENAELDVENAEVTEGFQLDEETETLNNIEGSVEEDGSAVVEAEHFTPTGVGSFGAPDNTQSEQDSGDTSTEATSRSVNFAESYQPNSKQPTNEWQILKGKYNTGSEITEDGSFLIQKNIIPTNTENEFYVYLNVEPSMSWDELFAGAGFYINNAWNERDARVDISNANSAKEELKRIAEAFNSTTAKLCTKEEDAKEYTTGNGNKVQNVSGITINLYDGEKFVYSYTINQTFYYALSAESNKSIILTFPFSDYAVKCRKISETGGKFVIEMDLSQFWNEGNFGDLSLLENDVVPTIISDEMGEMIEYESESYKLANIDSNETVDEKTSESGKTVLEWKGFEKVPASGEAEDYTSVVDDKGITHLFKKYAYQMVYKINLDVTDPDFYSCAEELFDGKEVLGSHYATNNSTQLWYNEVDGQGNPIAGGTNKGPIDFTSPVIRGLLYDVEFTKVDAEKEVPLDGAVFSLKNKESTSAEGETATSDKDGIVKFHNRPWGTYQLTEDTPPEGYKNSFEGSELTLCYTTNRDGLMQDHSEPHEESDWGTDIRNALYQPGADGKIGNQKEDGPTDETGDIPHSKRIDYLGDGDNNPDTDETGKTSYRLYLDVTGVPDVEKIEPVDVLLVLDTSASMRFNVNNNDEQQDLDKQRFHYVKEAAKNVVDTLKTANEANRIGIISFNYGGPRKSGDPEENTSIPKGATLQEPVTGTEVRADITQKLGTEELKGIIDGLGTSNRTNYGVALQKTKEQLDQVENDGRKKFVVFITDGEPNGYLDDGHDVNNTEKAKEAGRRAAKELKDLYGFYAISVSDQEASKYLSVDEGQGEWEQALIDYPEADVKMCLSANDEDQIKQAFAEVMASITRQICDVTIQDTLSEYVQFISDEEGEVTSDSIELKVEKTPSNSNGEIETLKEGDDYTLDLSPEGVIKVNFGEDYFLEPGATYTVSFNVRTTDEAAEYYKEHGYPVKGDEDTDYKTGNVENHSSSGQPGLYSNDEDSTYVEYTKVNIKNGQTEKVTTQEGYKRPVVQVKSIKVVIEKIIENYNNISEESKQDKFIISVKDHHQYEYGLALGHEESKTLGIQEPTQITIQETVPMEYNHGQLPVIEIWSMDAQGNPDKKLDTLKNGGSYQINYGDEILILVKNTLEHTNYFHDKDDVDNAFPPFAKQPRMLSYQNKDILKENPFGSLEGGDELNEVL